MEGYTESSDIIIVTGWKMALVEAFWIAGRRPEFICKDPEKDVAVNGMSQDKSFSCVDGYKSCILSVY